MLNRDDIKHALLTYVLSNTLADKNHVNEKSLLFKEGIFDSMTFVLLIDFIEEKFGVVLGDEDLVEENFESIEAIINYIIRKSERPVQ